MDRVPDAVVALLANDFLQDREALRLARASHNLLQALRRSYRLKKLIALRRAVAWATGCAEDGASTSFSFPSYFSPLPPQQPQLRVGLATHVYVTDACVRNGQQLQAQLDRLPPPVQHLRWHKVATEVLGPTLVRLPPQLRELAGFDFRGPAADVHLPAALTTLEFTRHFNRDVSGLQLPDGLRTLRFHSYFRRELSALHLPASLTELYVGGFNGPAADLPALPANLKSLDLGHTFNSPLDGVALPPNLRSLQLRSRFNQPMARVCLPESLTELTFGDEFNQPLDEVQWPPGLRSLRLGHGFKQSVKHIRLPPSLTHLDVFNYNGPHNWNHPPAGVTELNLPDYSTWNYPASQLRLPPSLTAFKLPYGFNQPLNDLHLPDGLRSLTITSWMRHPLAPLRMPPGLTDIDLSDYFQSTAGVSWPASLTRLAGPRRCAAAGLLPDWLVELRLCDDCDYTADRDSFERHLPLREMTLPPWLMRLELYATYGESLSDLRLPASLTALSLTNVSDEGQEGWRPPRGLRELHIGGGAWVLQAGQPLPPQLKVLRLNHTRSVADLTLPATLTELQLGTNGQTGSTQSLAALRLPPSLRALRLPSFGRLHTHDLDPALFAPPASGLPASLRELHVSEHAVRFDRLAAWNLPARCVVHSHAAPSLW